MGGRVRAYLKTIAFSTLAALVHLAMRDDTVPLDKTCLFRTFLLWKKRGSRHHRCALESDPSVAVHHHPRYDSLRCHCRLSRLPLLLLLEVLPSARRIATTPVPPSLLLALLLPMLPPFVETTASSSGSVAIRTPHRKIRTAVITCATFIAAVLATTAAAIGFAAATTCLKIRIAVNACATSFRGPFHSTATACKTAIRFVCNSEAVRSAVLKVVRVAGIGGASFCVGASIGCMTSILISAAQVSNYIGVVKTTTTTTDDSHTALKCFHLLWTVALCIEFWTREFTWATLTQHLFRGKAALGRKMAARCRHLWIAHQDKAIPLAMVASMASPFVLYVLTCRAFGIPYDSSRGKHVLFNYGIGYGFIFKTGVDWITAHEVSFVGTGLRIAASSVVALVDRAATVWDDVQIFPPVSNMPNRPCLTKTPKTRFSSSAVTNRNGTTTRTKITSGDIFWVPSSASNRSPLKTVTSRCARSQCRRGKSCSSQGQGARQNTTTTRTVKIQIECKKQRMGTLPIRPALTLMSSPNQANKYVLDTLRCHSQKQTCTITACIITL